MSYQKNTAGQEFNVLAINTSTGLPITGDAANITAKISIDSAAFASVADTNPTELDATNAAGVYVFDLSQAETNGNVLTIVPVSTTANVQIDMLNIYTSAVKAQLDDIEDVVGDIDVATTTIESKTSQLTFTVANQVDANSLTGGTSPSAVADAVWDEAASGHNVGGSFGKFIRQMKEGLIVVEATVDDGSATTSSFQTTLPSSVNDYYNDDTLVFISGSLVGQSRIIADYDGGNLQVTFDEPFTSAPADSDEFILLAGHNLTLTQIQNTVWDAPTSAHAIPGSTGEAVASAASEVSVILPATGTVPKRNQGETIQVYNQEEITVAVAVFDLAGNPVDLSTTGLWFGVWDRSKNMVTTATPTGTATGFTVVVPKLDRIGSGLTWVVRDSSATGQVILTGPFDILSRPYQ